MSGEARKIIDEALGLPEQERAYVAEQLLLSLARPGASLDRVWGNEAEARLDAYRRGELRVFSLQEVFAKYKRE